MKKLRCGLSILLFVCLFWFLFQKLTYLVQYKVHPNDTIGSFYKEKRDSMDVLFVGSSHSFCSFSPMELWHERGIASYNLATDSQPIVGSYFLIKEGIRMQHPKVIILETYGMNYSKDYDPVRLHQAVDNIPLNASKLELVFGFLSQSLEFDDRVEYLFPIVKYHTRWDKLKGKDYHPKNTWIRGYYVKKKIVPAQEPEIVTETMDVNDTHMEYLGKIIELCEKENVELILCQTNTVQKNYRSVCAKLNTVQKYAEEKGIPYINYELLRDEIDWDYATDFGDSMHANVFGADKLLGYMIQYLDENYELPDHRGEEEYFDWDEDYKAYSKMMKKHRNNLQKQKAEREE